MRKRAGIAGIGFLLALGGGFLPTAAQQAASRLPRVITASVPFYPPIAASASIQGSVTLRLSTDGQQVSAVEVTSGHPLLVSAAKENVATWRFEEHRPTTFETNFQYQLLDYVCESGCDCKMQEAESVLIRFPIDVQVNAPIPLICDPVAETRLLPPTAEHRKELLPRIGGASIPSYPPLARVASIEGVVNLRISVDGKYAVTIDSESGHPLLVRAAEENVATWEFEPHKPVTFNVRFTYKLSPAPPCEIEFDGWDPKNQSVLLQLPMSVELNSVGPRICDPAVTIEEKK